MSIMRLFIVASRILVYVIHKHILHGETYRQLSDAARRPQESLFSPHSTALITATDHDNYCAIIGVFQKLLE